MSAQNARNRLAAALEKANAGEGSDSVLATVEASITRKCGRCTGCCTALGVDAIGKKDGERCVHEVRHRGCGIYADRPPQCRTFFCLWKLGFGTRKDAPDQIGVVFDGYTNDRGQQVLRAAELYTGAMNDGTRGAVLAAELSARCDQMLILRKDGTRALRTR